MRLRFAFLFIISCTCIQFHEIISETTTTGRFTTKPQDKLPQGIHYGIRAQPNRHSHVPNAPHPELSKNEWMRQLQGHSEKDILSQYHLYQYEGFREYIQQLSEFEDVIYDFYDEICRKLRKNVVKRVIYEWFTLGDSLKNAKRYVGDLVEKANERKAERRKKQEEARKRSSSKSYEERRDQGIWCYT